ncbi:MAG TPA: hypothetical protein VIL85_14275 [Thermomicrobiales bacterium]|jgi:hypothetical protein
MLIDMHRYPLASRCPQSAPDPAREEVLNQLCTLREDPRFAEWCRLTSALGLGNLSLGQLAALHADAAETIFPEVGEWGQPEVSGFTRQSIAMSIPFGFAGRDGARDAVLGDGTATTWHADGLPLPGVAMSEAFGVMDGAVFDGRFGDASAHDGRGK